MANATKNEINYYDDKKHNYVDFWEGRDYEHFAEVAAIDKLLKNRHFAYAADLGGGYGRLSPTLLSYSDNLYLIDPSIKQLDIGKKRMASKKNVEYLIMDKENKIPLGAESVDLLVMVRVSHHLHEPLKTFKDINRVLKPGGMAIVEIASQADMLNRLKYASKLKPVPKTSTKIGQFANGKEESTPFYNHHPKTMLKLLKEAGFKPVKVLSVSNLRNQKVKKTLKVDQMVKIETKLQSPLAKIYFGPSIFILAEKIS